MMIVVIGLLGTGETTWNIGVWYRCYEVGHASGARYQVRPGKGMTYKRVEIPSGKV